MLTDSIPHLQKLLKDLEKARDAPAEAKTAAPATTQVQGEAPAAPDAGSHVRFGDLAMQMEAQGAADAPVAVPGTDAVEAKRTRAKIVLAWMLQA